MKKIIGFTLILLFSNTLFAQKRCGITDYLRLLENNHPEIMDEKINLEKDIQKWIKDNPKYKLKSIITIPVVVHVVYNSPQQNISDQQIQSPSLYNKKGRKAKPMEKLEEKDLKIASTR